MNFWYRRSLLGYLLWPLSLLYQCVVLSRRLLYRVGIFKIYRAPVPVVVIGNISVGGTGKTPLLIHLCKLLQAQGLQPGVVSRGYKGRASHYPQLVTLDSNPRESGDEPCLIARETGCPVVVDPRRARGCEFLLHRHACDVILSDDGLQHLSLGREVEIAVVDAERQAGNGFCLPAGPLRESIDRLKQVDFVIEHGETEAVSSGMQLVPSAFIDAKTGERLPLDYFKNQKIHGVAGIGNPSRFFTSLQNLGCEVIPHRFADHHDYQESDIASLLDYPIVMTSKDMIKCAKIKLNMPIYYLEVRVRLNGDFEKIIIQRIIHEISRFFNRNQSSHQTKQQSI